MTGMHGMVLGKKDMWPLSIEAVTVIVVVLIIDIITIISSNDGHSSPIPPLTERQHQP